MAGRFLSRSFQCLLTLLALLPAGALAQSNPTGACCVINASGSLVCVELSQSDCTLLGGQFDGRGTRCSARQVCRGAPTGACCINPPGGGGGGGGRPACTDLNEVQCANAGGNFVGAGTSCQSYQCPRSAPPTGACCFAGGVCTVLTGGDCHRQGGNYRRDGTTCTTTPCPGAPIGACCISQRQGPPGGTPYCIVTDRITCGQRPGVYQGDGTNCRSANCPTPPPPTGACCFAAGACTQLTGRDCHLQGGNYQRDGTTCSNTPCRGAPTGACCVPQRGGPGVPGGSANCIVTDQVTCSLRTGHYQGDNVTCRAANCPIIQQGTGACCVQNPSGGFHCVDVSPATCTLLGGTFSGLHVPCVSVPCPPTSCPCDWNHDGVVDAADEAAFLSDYFAGNADIDGDGDTDNDDLTAFYNCYRAGCP